MDELGTSTPVLLSVICKTYNQEKFIAQTLDSILMQQTNFAFEILINDDASTDNTTAIVKDYANRYPDIIKPLIEKENQFSKGINSHFKNSIPRAQGKYLAICDGDDYWTDPLKLQKQVDFLEQHKECYYVYTKNKTLKPDSSLYSRYENDPPLPSTFDFKYFFENKIRFPATLSIVFRRDILPDKMPDYLIKIFNGDWAVLVLSCYKGKIGFINESTCVYREGIGILSTTNNIYKFKNGLALNKKLNKHTNFEFDYCLGNYEYHYQNITYGHLKNKELKNTIRSFLTTINYSIRKHRFPVILKNNSLFILTLLKRLYNVIKK